MDMDRTGEEEKKKKKKKNKGKGKQTVEDEEEEEMELVGGAGRCHACVRDNAQCRVNMWAILRWRASIEAGRVTARAPMGTSCLRCNTSLHRPCDLPGTRDLRKKVNAKKAEIAAEKAKADTGKEAAGGEEVKVAGGLKWKGTEEKQATSGSKRRRVVVEVEPRNKPHKLTEGEFRLQVVELMGMLVDEVKGVRHGLSLHNVLQRSLCAREGLVPQGDLPVETFVYDGRVWVWGTETEWVAGETDEESSEEEEEEDDEGEEEDDEGEEEEEEEEDDDDDEGIVIEEQEQEEPERDAEE